MSIDVVDLAIELVSVPSLSGMERDIAYLLRDLLSGCGVDKAFIDRYGNVIGVIKGGVDRVVILEGHMDHVPPGDLGLWRVDPYKPVVIDDRLYGRGAVDMKGAIASMIACISRLGREKDLPTIYTVFVPYEEVSEGLLFKKAIEETQGVKPDLVVLGEATNLNISIGQRGRCVVEVTVKGRSAHASMPMEGVNALAGASAFINNLLLHTNMLPRHSLLGASTVSPTIIDCSPKSPPMIPDKCRLLLDYRLVIGEAMESIVGFVKKFLEELRDHGVILDYSVGVLEEKAVMWTGVEIDIRHYYPAWIYCGELAVKAVEAIRENVNPYVETIVWKFSTDGVYSAGEKEFPTIGFGPGDERLAHKPNEYVPVKHLYKAVEGYRVIIEETTRSIT